MPDSYRARRSFIRSKNQQVTDIRHQPHGPSASSVADAGQEAAELVRKASEQAAATLAAAELEAAEIRATVTRLAAELSAVAAYVTENLVRSVSPTTNPVTKPTPEPVIEPEARSAAKAETRPQTRSSRPADEPGTRPVAKPSTRSGRPEGFGRQLVAVRVAAVATAALVLFAVIAGSTEVALHGFRFFVFRSTGTGETGPSGLEEDQGPGQPDAPKPTPSHIKVRPSPHIKVQPSPDSAVQPSPHRAATVNNG